MVERLIFKWKELWLSARYWPGSLLIGDRLQVDLEAELSGSDPVPTVRTRTPGSVDVLHAAVDLRAVAQNQFDRFSGLGMDLPVGESVQTGRVLKIVGPAICIEQRSEELQSFSQKLIRNFLMLSKMVKRWATVRSVHRIDGLWEDHVVLVLHQTALFRA